MKSILRKSICCIIMIVLVTPFTHAQSYQQVHDIVFNQSPITADDSDTVQTEKRVYLSGTLPQYQVTSEQFSKKATQQLANRTKQTLIDTNDYYDRLEKLVHSNGICMSGLWYMTEEPKNLDNKSYTGMFTKGTVSPFIGRLSVALSETKQGTPQGFGMAGKLFGVNDINKEVITENFFVADVLTGTKRDSVFDAPMTNKPKVGFRFSILKLGLKIAPLFSKADSNSGIRPVTGIARMGVAKSKAVISPNYMMLVPIKPDNHEITTGIDFRDEFSLTQEKILNDVARYFVVYVSDTASQAEQAGWQHIGFIKIDKTIVSYGCDRQLHFAHPKTGFNNE